MIILKKWSSLVSFKYRVCEISGCDNKYYYVHVFEGYNKSIDVCESHKGSTGKVVLEA